MLAQGDDIVPIPGTKRAAHLEENLAALEIELTDEDLARIERGLPARRHGRRALSGHVDGESLTHASTAAAVSLALTMPEPAGKVADSFETRIRELEERSLSPLAVRSYETRGRAKPEQPCRLRTPFQRDRDRIVHSKAFRRLEHKTQVFIDPEGDHYRTRLTHTLETTGISRGVARALGLNEELTEAIGLGHDLGHTPFGHAGEEALDAALRERFGRRFRHNEHSLRVVDVLERDGRGLNLTDEVRDGILNHTGETEPADARGQDRAPRRPGRLHQPRHRRRDPRRRRLGRTTCRARRSRCSATRARAGSTGSCTTSSRRSSEAGDIRQSEEIGEAMLVAARLHVRARLPRPRTRRPSTSARTRSCARSSHYLLEHPETIPAESGDLVEHVTDYLAGMTDRFALTPTLRARV